MPDQREVDAAAEVRRAARELDHDRYLAALLAPSSARDPLLTIAAFHGEIARIPASVHEPTIAAIRLQWWRDALEDPSSAATGSPVADAMRRALLAKEIEPAAPLAIIDAYEALLHPGSLAAPEAITAFADAGQGAAFRMAARVLGAAAGEDVSLMTAAAQCYGRVQLLRALPILLDKGHNPLDGGASVDWEPVLGSARAELAVVRRLAPLASATMLQAILPVALVEPYLKALEGLGSKLASEQATISPLSRVWRIYLGKRLRRF